MGTNYYYKGRHIGKLCSQGRGKSNVFILSKKFLLGLTWDDLNNLHQPRTVNDFVSLDSGLRQSFRFFLLHLEDWDICISEEEYC